MSWYLAFSDKYSNEAACIQTLADLKWPHGFACDKCQGRKAYHLASRPRLFECAACGHQHSITAGTIFHKTRTPLRKWFVAAYLVAHDKRGVSALYISRELAIRYDTAWLMCHKIRHALTQSATAPLLDGCIELDKASYGSGRQKGNRRRTQTEGKPLIVCGVQRVNVAGTANEAIHRQRIVAGNARIAVLPDATAEQLGGFIRSNIKAGATIIGNGLEDNRSLGEPTRYSILQCGGAHVSTAMLIVHKLFSNIKAWLTGTYHGVSTKHLPRYLREWAYRFNRRGKIADLDFFLLRRAVRKPTISYDQLVAGRMVLGAT